jgi:hypothetical protein
MSNVPRKLRHSFAFSIVGAVHIDKKVPIGFLHGLWLYRLNVPIRLNKTGIGVVQESY